MKFDSGALSAICVFMLLMSASSNASEWVEIKPEQLKLEAYSMSPLLVSERYITKPEGLQQLSVFKMQKTEVSCDEFLSLGSQLTHERQRRITLRCEDYPYEPVTGVTLQEAKAYCLSIGGTLPSEEQWLAAALYKHSLDSAINSDLAKSADDEETIDFIVDVEDGIEEPSGLIGMEGNVWEMTKSAWDSSQSSFVIKGGAFDMVDTPYLLNPLFRAAYKPDDTLNKNIGFRCIK